MIRQALGADPDVALAICVGALARRGLLRKDMNGVGLAAHVRQMDDHADLDEARSKIAGQLPDGDVAALDWALGMSRDRLLATLAVLVASSLDLAHEGASAADLRLQAIGDRLAQRLDIDMTRFWTADLGYWLRLPKSALVGTLLEAFDTPAGSGKRDNLLRVYAKLRKEELARRVTALHDKTSYLPSLLVTPIAASILEVTQAGEEMLAAPPVAAE